MRETVIEPSDTSGERKRVRWEESGRGWEKMTECGGVERYEAVGKNLEWKSVSIGEYKRRWVEGEIWG